MKLDKGEIRIYYKAKGGVDFDLDNFFQLLLKLMGYHFYACGTDMKTLTRELCFEKEKANK